MLVRGAAAAGPAGPRQRSANRGCSPRPRTLRFPACAQDLRAKQAPLLQRPWLHRSPVLGLDVVRQREVPLSCRLLRLLSEDPYGKRSQVSKGPVVQMLDREPPVCAGAAVVWAVEVAGPLLGAVRVVEQEL